MGARSRKRGRTAQQAGARPAPGATPRTSAVKPPSRGELKDAAVRAELEPLEPGEYPAALSVAIALSLFVALSNVGLIVAGYEIREGGEGTAFQGIVFAIVMLVAAWGMWKHRYWAVLGFQTLLMITVVISGLSLMVASNLAAVALCGALVGFGGWLFWKLVRVLSRMKTPSAFDAE